MALERTLSIIKPDAVAKNLIGAIYTRFESAGLRIVASKMMHLSKEQAEGFYAEHSERPFFGALVEFMTSGPIVVQVLEGEEAILKTVKSWVQRTLPTHWRARFVQTMLKLSTRTQYTVLTQLKQQHAKSRTSSAMKRSAHVLDKSRLLSKTDRLTNEIVRPLAHGTF